MNKPMPIIDEVQAKELKQHLEKFREELDKEIAASTGVKPEDLRCDTQIYYKSVLIKGE